MQYQNLKWVLVPIVPETGWLINRANNLGFPNHIQVKTCNSSKFQEITPLLTPFIITPLLTTFMLTQPNQRRYNCSTSTSTKPTTTMHNFRLRHVWTVAFAFKCLCFVLVTAQFSRSFPPIASFLLLYGTLELEVHIRGDHCCDDILKNNKI